MEGRERGVPAFFMKSRETPEEYRYGNGEERFS